MFMGGFYGSVHVRSNDQTAVKAALQAIAVKQEARFLLGPVVNGWVSIYPNHSGQDERLAKVIARGIQGECIYVVVHDDDIFAYDYFQDGKRIDSYNSRPDYFQEVSPREKARLRGRPRLLEHLLAPGRSLQELASLLSENSVEESPFASNQLEGFAGLLGLPNAITAYEYLMDGETDGVERWDKFIHVPDLSAENAQKEAANTETLQEKERLRQAGLLVYESRGPDSALLVSRRCGQRLSGVLDRLRRPQSSAERAGACRPALVRYADTDPFRSVCISALHEPDGALPGR
jgi:hypothetical protein